MRAGNSSVAELVPGSDTGPMDLPPGFDRHDLGDGRAFFTGRLPAGLALEARRFEELWSMHPAEFHEIRMHGRAVRTPRWQQAYGMDYRYTGRINRALPLPPLLEPLLAWVRQHLDARLNGVLLNWYDGALGHYIGRHRDSRTNLISGAPIVTISFGEQRQFRLSPWPRARGRQCLDFPAQDGAVFVMPYETNLHWTHEVPAARQWQGRRISVTLRAFVAPGG
jgi:alkylated DNA repair dioxygenase AlkB